MEVEMQNISNYVNITGFLYSVPFNAPIRKIIDDFETFEELINGLSVQETFQCLFLHIEESEVKLNYQIS